MLATETPFLKTIFTRRMLICLFIGFSSGLPFWVIIQMVPAWLRTEGVGLKEIGFFTLVQLPYIWKFAWAPLLDRYTLPFAGRRRGWILLSQILILIVVAVLGFNDPQLDIQTIAALSFLLALFSASQDVVLDAYRRELLPDNELGLGNSLNISAYRVAGLVPGALALILADHIPWSSVFVCVSLFMLLGIGMTLCIKEAVAEPAIPKTLREAIVEPFKDILNRNGVKQTLLIIVFMFTYKLGDSMATALQTPFFIDMGFSLTEIGSVAKVAGLSASIVGGLFGGLVLIKMGINRGLWLFGVVQLVTILGFAWLATVGYNLSLLALVMAAEYAGVGMGTAAFVAFIARSTSPAYAATQLALFTALAAMPRTAANAVSGVIVEQIGWASFFLLCTVCALPGMLLLFKVAPWQTSTAISREKI